MENYFILNLETGKLELHFEKETYKALSEEKKEDIKSYFLWGRNSGCWISRRKTPNLHRAIECAKSIGLNDAGTSGERLSFAEQMERKAEKAERRADRYEYNADAAEKRAEILQKPINDMHGDIAFFTQPNVNTSAGRAFTNRRNKMWASFERGFEEFRKSEYWQGRAAAARSTASQEELKDKAFVERRIRERESDLRKIKKNIEEYECYLKDIQDGKEPTDRFGWRLNLTEEKVNEYLEHWLDRMEIKLDELGFYQGCLEELGGIAFSWDNVKPGYIVSCKHWGRCEIISTGPKNCTVKGTWGSVKISYADILEIIEKPEKPAAHPFIVGDTFTCNRWNKTESKYETVTFTIIKVTDKSATLQTGQEKPFVRKPAKSIYRNTNEWYIHVCDSNNGTWYKDSAPEISPEDFMKCVGDL